MNKDLISLITKVLIQEISSKDELSKEISEYKKNSAKIASEQKSIESILKSIKDQSAEETKRLALIIKYMDDFKVNQSEGDDWVANLEKVPKYKYPSAEYKTLWLEAMSKLNEATQKVLKGFENAHLDAKRKETKPELIIKDKEKLTENKDFKVGDIVIFRNGKDHKITKISDDGRIYLKQVDQSAIIPPKEFWTKASEIKDKPLKEENILKKGFNWLKNLLFGIKEFNTVVNNLPTISASLIHEEEKRYEASDERNNHIFGFGQWWHIDDIDDDLLPKDYKPEDASKEENEGFKNAVKRYQKTKKPQVSDYYND